jgi:hypothetical protein
MPSKSVKIGRKQLLRKAKLIEKRKAESELPASVDEMRELIERVDERLEGVCDHTLRYTLDFVRQRGLDEQRIVPWLRHFGGHCDCGVVINVDDSCRAFRSGSGRGEGRRILDKLLHQERTPVCTLILLVSTVAIEALILLMIHTPIKGYETIGAYFFTVLLVLVAVVSNVVGGWVAHKREEFWGGRIAILGIAVWLATALPAMWIVPGRG